MLEREAHKVKNKAAGSDPQAIKDAMKALKVAQSEAAVQERLLVDLQMNLVAAEERTLCLLITLTIILILILTLTLTMNIILIQS